MFFSHIGFGAHKILSSFNEIPPDVGHLGNRSSLDQHDPELFRDEQERPSIILKGEQLEPKQEARALMVTPP